MKTTRMMVAVLLALAAVQAQAAKNVILMISDGAGFNTFEAASYYQHGALGQQVYDSFDFQAASTHWMLNADGTPQGYDPTAMWSDFNYVKGNNDYTAFTDSAAAATALYTGQKTTNGAISVDRFGNTLTTVAEIAVGTGRATGAVSSVEFSHATPAAVDAHNVTRNDYVGIANEMIYNSDLDVIMGCGEGHSTNKYVGGDTTWADIIDADGANGFEYVADVADFASLADGTYNGGNLPSKVLGIAHATYTLGDNPGNVPTLQTMTEGALNVLAQDADGFFLMVEGGAVDWHNHSNLLAEMIDEQIDFNNSVESVVAWIEDPTNGSSWNDTLLVVTADHETGMLWGPGTYTDNDNDNAYTDGYDTFNGWQHVANNGAGNLPGVQWGSGGHTNALVPVYAHGAGSDVFAGLIRGNDAQAGTFWGFSGDYLDNTDIFTAMNAAVPEPMTMALLGLGSLVLVRRKR